MLFKSCFLFDLTFIWKTSSNGNQHVILNQIILQKMRTWSWLISSLHKPLAQTNKNSQQRDNQILQLGCFHVLMHSSSQYSILYFVLYNLFCTDSKDCKIFQKQMHVWWITSHCIWLVSLLLGCRPFDVVVTYSGRKYGSVSLNLNKS